MSLSFGRHKEVEGRRIKVIATISKCVIKRFSLAVGLEELKPVSSGLQRERCVLKNCPGEPVW